MAELEARKRLSPDECIRKAKECREMAQRTREQSHRVMLLHMAETWERIADTYSTDE